MALSAAVEHVAWLKIHVAAAKANPAMIASYVTTKDHYLSQVPDNQPHQGAAIGQVVVDGDGNGGSMEDWQSELKSMSKEELLNVPQWDSLSWPFKKAVFEERNRRNIRRGNGRSGGRGGGRDGKGGRGQAGEIRRLKQELADLKKRTINDVTIETGTASTEQSDLTDDRSSVNPADEFAAAGKSKKGKRSD
mmetsp:Transcript_30386/g.65737  ORF Transcript_30386/g.65737 Transcript_30386/m.65737 type:complete len:192 (+) Transcript_30386:175-750(+)